MLAGNQPERQTLEQKRATSAWMHLEQVTTDTQRKKYGTLARKLPAMIQMNGLGGTLAFLMSKGQTDLNDAHNMIARHLSEWILTQPGIPPGYTDLMHMVRAADMSVYRRATTEAIEYCIWLKRYAEARDWGSVQGDD